MTPAAPPEKMMLEPCGCGGVPAVHRTNVFPGGLGFFILCDSPKCQTQSGVFPTAPMARRAWNAAMGEADRRLAPRVGDDVLSLICNDVAELGDRTSPEDWPEAMLVTADELRSIITDRLSAPPAASAEREEMARTLDPMAFDDGPFSTDAGDKERQRRRQGIALTLADQLIAAGWQKRAIPLVRD